MPEGMIDLAELPHSWLNAEPVDCMKGACHLTSKYHGIELFDRTAGHRHGLMDDVAICAQALKEVTDAVKINYEIHGNSTPHLHVHLYPRYLDDPFPNRPIDHNRKTSEI
jgi:diadenosine tetraphosphate (Ap4A) HIT family hydrolase